MSDCLCSAADKGCQQLGVDSGDKGKADMAADHMNSSSSEPNGQYSSE